MSDRKGHTRAHTRTDTTAICVRVPQHDADLKEVIERAARSSRITTSEWVRRALRREAERQQLETMIRLTK